MPKKKKKKEEASNAWFSEGRIVINLIYLRFPHTYIKKQTTLCICVFFSFYQLSCQ